MILKLFGEKDLALPFIAKYEEENIITLDHILHSRMKLSFFSKIKRKERKITAKYKNDFLNHEISEIYVI